MFKKTTQEKESIVNEDDFLTSLLNEMKQTCASVLKPMKSHSKEEREKGFDLALSLGFYRNLDEKQKEYTLFEALYLASQQEEMLCKTSLTLKRYYQDVSYPLQERQLAKKGITLTFEEKTTYLRKYLQKNWSDEAIQILFLNSKNHKFLIDDVIEAALEIEGQTTGQDIGSLPLSAVTLPSNEMKPALGRVYALSTSEQGGGIHKVVSRLSCSEDHGVIGELGETAKASWRIACQLANAQNSKLLTHQSQIIDKADGPSAGIAYFASIHSALNSILLPPGLALTGALELDGTIQPIGGLTQKVVAVKRFGLRHLIVPQGNKVDIESLPPMYTQGLEISYVDNLESLQIVLDGFKQDRHPPVN